METIQSDEFIFIGVEFSKSLLYIRWLPPSAHISDEYFKEINQVYVKVVAEKKLKYGLLDTQDFGYTISPQMQNWVIENTLSQLSELGLKKIAFLTSRDFITQLSIEQTMEEKMFAFSIKYFNEQEIAEKWLTNYT